MAQAFKGWVVGSLTKLGTEEYRRAEGFRVITSAQAAFATVLLIPQLTWTFLPTEVGEHLALLYY